MLKIVKVIMDSNEIKQARKKLNFTQQMLADRLGVTAKTVSNWEAGFSEASDQIKEKIQSLLIAKSKGGDVIEIGDDSPGAGKGNKVNSDSVMLRALDEIAAQRKLTENALAELSASQQQVKELISLLKLKIVNP